MKRHYKHFPSRMNGIRWQKKLIRSTASNCAMVRQTVQFGCLSSRPSTILTDCDRSNCCRLTKEQIENGFSCFFFKNYEWIFFTLLKCTAVLLSPSSCRKSSWSPYAPRITCVHGRWLDFAACSLPSRVRRPLPTLPWPRKKRPIGTTGPRSNAGHLATDRATKFQSSFSSQWR